MAKIILGYCNLLLPNVILHDIIEKSITLTQFLISQRVRARDSFFPRSSLTNRYENVEKVYVFLSLLLSIKNLEGGGVVSRPVNVRAFDG